MKYRSLALSTLVAFAVAPVFAGRAAEPAAVGQPAPAWSLSDQEGKTQNLKDYQGKYVVLEWFNKDCPFVKKHYGSGNMQGLQKWAKEKGVVWLNVISSKEGKQGYLTADEAKEVMKDHKMASKAILFDTDGKVGKAYGAKTTPHMYVIDPKGVLIYNGGIDDKATPSPADIASSRNHVKSALEEAMAGKQVSVQTSQPYGCSVKY
ncbi:MAG: thioredoxin family protein [Fimbriimonas sp.]